jgi:hypothetical protein
VCVCVCVCACVRASVCVWGVHLCHDMRDWGYLLPPICINLGCRGSQDAFYNGIYFLTCLLVPVIYWVRFGGWSKIFSWRAQVTEQEVNYQTLKEGIIWRSIRSLPFSRQVKGLHLAGKSVILAPPAGLTVSSGTTYRPKYLRITVSRTNFVACVLSWIAPNWNHHSNNPISPSNWWPTKVNPPKMVSPFVGSLLRNESYPVPVDSLTVCHW